MIESEFQDVVDRIMWSMEEQIDASGADLDYETSAGVMTVTCENDGSKIILSRQPANREIWVAALSGGFHFSFKDGDWRCATGETLTELLMRVIAEQSGETIQLQFID